ncbi:hypothetical protein CC86DRAFT_471212 [Ophiobolus disseminans]|uniref:F-box domain-containing protein n=1 Tax=Ophiobolus disseminans TaxID=1469910 RepID=A0A6A6ZIY3_9PLEO|nr:hypothetical protein CC86DRAFT_471212 [Ophiobolus disseminans]
MQQPWTISSGLNTCALLALPAEVRNQIFEALLVRPGFFKLKTYPAALPTASGFLIAEQIHDIRPLFLSCKQIREESLGIFYKQNHFKIFMPDGSSSDGESIGYHFDQVGIWLEALGKQLLLLRRVSIGISLIDTVHVANSTAMLFESHVSLLQIYRVFWKTSGFLLFALDLFDTHVQPRGPSQNAPASVCLDLKCIKNVLWALIQDHDLKVKHLQKSMTDITLCGDGSNGCITWRGSRQQVSYLRQGFISRFHQADDGFTLRYAPHHQIPYVDSHGQRRYSSSTSIMRSANLPNFLEYYLWDWVAVHEPSAVVNLTAGTWIGDGPTANFLYSNKRLHHSQSWKFWAGNRFELRLRAPQGTHSFSDYQRLNAFITWDSMWVVSDSCSAIRGETSMSLHNLRQKAVIALSDTPYYCCTEPEGNVPPNADGRTPDATPWGYFWRPCPELWLNSECEIVIATNRGWAIPVSLVPEGQRLQPGENCKDFVERYKSHYSYDTNPYKDVNLSDNYSYTRHPHIANHMWLTRHADGTLISHINYLLSVLSVDDDADLWAKIYFAGREDESNRERWEDNGVRGINATTRDPRRLPRRVVLPLPPDVLEDE